MSLVSLGPRKLSVFKRYYRGRKCVKFGNHRTHSELSVIERCHYSSSTCKTFGVFGTNTGTVYLQGVSLIAVRKARSLVTREHT